MPLSYLAGLVPLYKHWKCIDIASDLLYFGIRSYEPEEFDLINDQGVKIFDSASCTVDKIEEIHSEMKQVLQHSADQKYWISFDIDGVDAKEFKSTGTDEYNGLPLDFCYKLFEKWVPRSMGMDFSEVNFMLTEGAQREKDQ